MLYIYQHNTITDKTMIKKKQNLNCDIKNFYLMRVYDGDTCLTTIKLKTYNLTNMKHLITEISRNYTGGITFWIDIQTNNK